MLIVKERRVQVKLPKLVISKFEGTALDSFPSVYHFGQFLIKQISSAFLLLGLLNRFLTLNLLLFCCNCFSSYLIYIVKARLEVFVYSDFFVDMFTMHKYLYSLLIFLNSLKTI